MMIRMATPILSMMSAKLKTGKLNTPTLMKSLTPQYVSLSMKFPAVPAIKNAVINRLIFFMAKSRMNAMIPAMLTAMIKMKGTGNDRDIPVFNVGRINEVCSRYLRL